VEARRGRRGPWVARHGGQRRRCCTAEGEQRKKKGGHQGLSCELQKLQGPHCNTKFSTILKLKFKPYNFYLGFKFKNSKDRALFSNLGLNSNFLKFLSLLG
jgi:hypothetical protein